MKQPRLKRDWIGLRVRTRRKMTTNGGTTLPAGSICVVTDSFGGLRLETEKCSACGVQVTIKKVHPGYVEIIDRDEAVTTESAGMRRRRK